MTIGLLPRPTDEQAMLVDASARFIEAELPMTSVRKHADGAEHPDAAYRRMASREPSFDSRKRRAVLSADGDSCIHLDIFREARA
jgi:hypothetical protein